MTRSTDAYHLVGVGGIGMSAIARLLLADGAHVSGSDVRRTPLTDALAAEGVDVAIGHRAGNLNGARTVVVSSAIAAANPEVLEAGRRGIPVVTRGAMLARLAQGRKLVAVAGTHGKTTTTAMLAAIFERAGLDPTVLIGGIPTGAASNARTGRSEWFVSEADESDHSFLELEPAIAIVTNIENDHIASDAELPRLLNAFDTFATSTRRGGTTVIGLDNAASADLARRLPSSVTCAVHAPHADITAHGPTYADLGSRFTVLEHGDPLGEIALQVPGEINVQNALAAVAAARSADIAFAPIAEALAAFAGVGRRFEIVAREPITVVDDYAHHPTAVAQTIAAARTAAHGRPLIVAFQPHRYTRTAYLKDDFARALQGADRVYLTPIYAASEPPIPGIDERSIGDPLVASGTPVTYVDDVEELADRIPREAPDGALVLMLGAGSISQVAHALGRRLDAALA